MVFECSQDAAIWPWLALPSTHQIAVQSANFWASVESGMTLGTFDPGKWSALTEVEWSCGPHEVGRAVRGRYAVEQSGDARRYGLEFFDKADRSIVRLSGRGVVFQTRNFETWRDQAKARIVKPEYAVGFEYASAGAVGVAEDRLSFLTPLQTGSATFADGLITKANGLIPGHPLIGGSGDHVNSTHMGEVGRQFAALLAGPKAEIIAGAMDFKHYVELGRPFRVDLVQHDEAARHFELLVCQAERTCTWVAMTYAVPD